MHVRMQARRSVRGARRPRPTGSRLRVTSANGDAVPEDRTIAHGRSAAGTSGGPSKDYDARLEVVTREPLTTWLANSTFRPNIADRPLTLSRRQPWLLLSRKVRIPHLVQVSLVPRLALESQRESSPVHAS